jgi:hypothetical protein
MFGGRSHREFVAIGLADDDRAGRFEARDDRGVIRRPKVAEDARSAVARMSRTQIVSLIATGTPCSAPDLSLARSSARARASARSASTVMKAFKVGFSRSIRASDSDVTCSADRSPRRIASRSSMADAVRVSIG